MFVVLSCRVERLYSLRSFSCHPTHFVKTKINELEVVLPVSLF
jgi:hypothetical protein